MSSIVKVNFRGADLYAVETKDDVFVALKPIVDGMGLDWSSQLKRARRDAVLSEGMVMMTIPLGRGGPQEAVCLSLDFVPGWLFKIDSRRVSPNIREQIQTYQRECYRVLNEHFRGARRKLARSKEISEGVRARLVTEARQTFGHRTAVQMWKKLDLPTVPAMEEAFAQIELFDKSKN